MLLNNHVIDASLRHVLITRSLPSLFLGLFRIDTDSLDELATMTTSRENLTFGQARGLLMFAARLAVIIGFLPTATST